MKRTGSVLDILVASVNLIVLQYLLACAELSFWKHPLFILFFACDIYLITCYLESLKRSVATAWLRYLLCGLCIAVVVLGVMWWGYFPIGTLPTLL